MSETDGVKFYPPTEEKINIASHLLGLFLSIIGLLVLIMRANMYDDILHIVSYSIFGISLIILYAASSIYHSAKTPALRKKLRIVDHAAIYVLIAGTYTPFTLITLNGTVGWTIFGISWGMAFTGIILKLFFTGKYKRTSTLMYVLMGWIIIFAIKPLMNNLSAEGLQWLIAGGLSYTLGAILYGIKKIKFNHAIFHIFVLAGSICHFISVAFYI